MLRGPKLLIEFWKVDSVSSRIKSFFFVFAYFSLFFPPSDLKGRNRMVAITNSKILQITFKMTVTKKTNQISSELINLFSTPMLHLCRNQAFDFYQQNVRKHLWKIHILSKYSGRSPAPLLKISLFHRCFSNIWLVKTNSLVST